MIIKIFGSRFEGKTTLANIILKALEKEGFSMTHNDEVISEQRLVENIQKMKDSGDFRCEIKTINLKDERRNKYALDFERENE